MLQTARDGKMKKQNYKSQFDEYCSADLSRYGDSIFQQEKYFIKVFRKAQFCKNSLIKKFYRFLLYKYCEKRGLKISWRTKIGKGFYVGHPYAITINENAVIGENVNIHKGATIGQQNRGSKKGVPEIGNCVWIGINAVIVGNIKIGDDVLIAPNAYVNFDVPSHSIVVGNPGKVISRENATEEYINNKI